MALNIVDHFALLFVQNRCCCEIPSSFNDDAVDADAIDDDDFTGIFAAFNVMLEVFACVFVLNGVGDD